MISDSIETLFSTEEKLGAFYREDKGTSFRIWAPQKDRASVNISHLGAFPMNKKADGYFSALVPDAVPGMHYSFSFDGKTIPDPASRYQPKGIYGPSEIITDAFAWSDHEWHGIPFHEWVIYELHTGTYSDTGDFQGIIDDLPRLKRLGITTVELMPVAQFPGTRSWGYDGVFPFAVQNSYGRPEDLKKLVNACHAIGIAIILDVVYNHFGPEGNVVAELGPYFSEKYNTPWGKAFNFDDPHNAHVRKFFLQNAWQWLAEYHFDGLRVDAAHMIIDTSATPFLEELCYLKRSAEKKRGVPLVLIAESDKNDARILAAPEHNGLGFDAQWADDFHHCLHATLTGEHEGYYADYGGTEQLADIYRHGVLFTGQYSSYRKRFHGRSYAHIDRTKLIVETQNHDQVGNRLKGDRLITTIGTEKARLAAAAVLLSPFTPLIFMGEEYGEKNPFLFFVDYHDRKISDKIRQGRKKEWESFGWTEEPPDLSSMECFAASRLDKQINGMEGYYRQLIALSKRLRGAQLHVGHDDAHNRITLYYQTENHEWIVFLSFAEEQRALTLPDDLNWRMIIGNEKDDSSIPPFGVKVFERDV